MTRRPYRSNPGARLKTPPKPSPLPAEPLLVQIEKPVYGGAFLARAEGKAVFTPLTLPGENARVRIVEDKGGYANAELEEILASSSERIAPRCSHFGPCGGCHYQHAGYANQLNLKKEVLGETFERAGVPVPGEIAILAANPWAYRNRIRLAFDAAGTFGYRGRRSHAIVPIGECPIAAPLLIDAARTASKIADQFAFAKRPFEISFFCDVEQASLLAGVYTANPIAHGFNRFAEEFAQRVPPLRGVALANDGRPGKPARNIAEWGEGFMTYRAVGFDYRVDQGAFFQVNRWLIDPLVECVTAGHHGSLAWDLFSGVGLFARRLAVNFAEVVAVESAPAALPALEANLARSSASAVCATTLDFLRRSRNSRHPGLIVPDLIVVDPPRTGLGADIAALLAEIAAPAIVYVSCDPATLARDLRALLASGYTIESLTLADLFPQTFHIESVVRLRRA